MDERRKVLIQHAVGGQPSTQQLVDGLFGVNGYDGL